MKKKLLFIALLVVLMSLVCVTASAADVWNGYAASGFASGTGTESDPYIIETAEQLAFFARSVNGGNVYNGKYVKLADDIVLNDVSSVGDWSETPPATDRQ